MLQKEDSMPRQPNDRFRRPREWRHSTADAAAGLRPVQIWVPDTRAPDFAEKCRRQARAVAANDPAGDEIMDFIAQVYQWPKS